jgi:hypothetical protein
MASSVMSSSCGAPVAKASIAAVTHETSTAGALSALRIAVHQTVCAEYLLRSVRASVAPSV